MGILTYACYYFIPGMLLLIIVIELISYLRKGKK